MAGLASTCAARPHHQLLRSGGHSDAMANSHRAGAPSQAEKQDPAFVSLQFREIISWQVDGSWIIRKTFRDICEGSIPEQGIGSVQGLDVAFHSGARVGEATTSLGLTMRQSVLVIRRACYFCQTVGMFTF